jgi:hypothetical protein
LPSRAGQAPQSVSRLIFNASNQMIARLLYLGIISTAAAPFAEWSIPSDHPLPYSRASLSQHHIPDQLRSTWTWAPFPAGMGREVQLAGPITTMGLIAYARSSATGSKGDRNRDHLTPSSSFISARRSISTGPADREGLGKEHRLRK